VPSGRDSFCISKNIFWVLIFSYCVDFVISENWNENIFFTDCRELGLKLLQKTCSQFFLLNF
jgi:hypothetical protein